MNRPSSLRSAVAAADMSYRPNPRASRPWNQRGYCDNSSGSGGGGGGDSNPPAARGRGFRPNYNAVPPPLQFYPAAPRRQSPGPGPGPYRPQPRHPGMGYSNYQQFGPQNMQQQGQQPQFRPQQQYRPRSKPPDYREWESAKLLPSPECERFTVLSYNILADYLATDHYQQLYFHIHHPLLSWRWRRRSLSFELGLWSPDIMCFQEVDRFQDIEEDLKQRGYMGIWKMRTGDPVDGCAIFWRDSRFKLLHEESIEYRKLGLRDNVAQICVFELINGQNDISGTSSLSTRSANSQKVVVCNIHVLFNPKRGDIKLGQIRVLLDKANAVSKLWDDAPIVMCGDFNCTPKSPMYNFISEGKLDLSELPRNKVSGQDSAEIRTSRPAFPNSRIQSVGFNTPNESLTGPRSENESLTDSVGDVRDETVLVEPSCERMPSESTDVSASAESNLEIPPEVSVADAALDEKLACLSVNESVEETTVEDEEDSDSLSRSHDTGQSPFPSDSNISSENTHGDEILKDTLPTEDGPFDESKLLYDPGAWTPMEIETATGSKDCRVMEHLLNLTSSYTEVESSSRLRDSNGEPHVTSYHRRFLGTVDYIWHSEGLQTARVLAPIPKDVMQQQTKGFPTKKWGSDHIALVSEFAFSKDASSESMS